MDMFTFSLILSKLFLRLRALLASPVEKALAASALETRELEVWERAGFTPRGRYLESSFRLLVGRFWRERKGWVRENLYDVTQGRYKFKYLV